MNLKPIFEKLYPQGSVGPGEGRLLGQCAVLAQHLVQIGKVGDYLPQKINAIRQRGIFANELQLRFKPGDVVITNESKKHGHVLVINFVTYIENSDQAVSFRATEANYRFPLRIDHTRILNANSPVIIGVIRGKFLFSI